MRRKIRIITVIVVTFSMIISMGTVSFGEELAVMEEPVVEEPVVEEPVVEESVVEEPVAEEPVAEEPVVEEPVAEEPVAEEPVAEEPAVEEPVAEEPAAEEPAVEEPVAEEPVVEEPVVEEPVAEEPAVEEPVAEEPAVKEPVAEEPVAEEPAVEEPVVEEPVIEEPVIEEPVVEEPVVEEMIAAEPIFIEETIPRFISISASLELSKEQYSNGDIIEYFIEVENNGTEAIENLKVVDEMGLDENAGALLPENRVRISGRYQIDEYNRMESIGNTINLSADSEEGSISSKLGFQVPIDIPLGTIGIANRVDGLEGSDKEFDILIEGPDNYKCFVSLEDGEDVILKDLFLGSYSITPLDSMNYKSSSGEESVNITEVNPHEDVAVEYIQVNSRWFSDTDQVENRILVVVGDDVDIREMELQSSTFDKRSDEIYFELAPLIVLVEVQETAQPGGETVPAEATPVEDVVSDPVESITEDETTGSEPTLESEPLVEQNEDTYQNNIEEPEAIIPDSPSEESDEVDTQILDEGTEEPDTQAQPEEIAVPKDPEELPLDSV